MIDDVKTKGYVKFYEPGISDLVALDEHTLTNTEERQRDNGEKDIDPILHQRLTVIGSYLHTKYIKPTYPKAEYQYYNVWNGVDKDNQGWHTDFMEGYDLFFLYYFDTTKEETGGNISFRHDKGEDTFQPVKGDLFLVSNERGFWHKAGDTKIQRRVASFNFKTNAI
jgi:hypothetical protein|tara:strand:+ start:278 stop:778 length:501 start_codon:yes stop_codon:yes gene_type:complete